MKTIRLVLFVPPAPMAWAQHLGCFGSEGLEVAVTQTTSSDEIGQGLAQGRWDMGIAVMDNAVAWNARHAADLQVIAQLERHTELRFVCPGEDRSMADVARNPIAVDAVDNGFVLVLYRALAQQGIDWRSCTLEPVGGVRHRFDALMQGRSRSSIVIPPFDSLLQSKGYRTLWTRQEVAPAYPGMVVVARRQWLGQAHEAAVRFLRALLDAQDWALADAHRHDAIAVLESARYTRQMAEQLIDAPVKDLRPSLQGWHETLALRRECGLAVEPEPAVEEAIDMQPLQRALASRQIQREVR